MMGSMCFVRFAALYWGLHNFKASDILDFSYCQQIP